MYMFFFFLFIIKNLMTGRIRKFECKIYFTNDFRI